MTTVLALDAMGVVFSAADDVAELLVPYLREQGCTLDDAEIEEVYTACSLGLMTSAQLWERCGVDGSDDDYCSRHELTPGTTELLADVAGSVDRILVLSNDVSEWSRLLRDRFGLTRWVPDWVVSGDLGVRKPDSRAYEALVNAAGVPAADIHFFDDRPRNVDAAREGGLQAHLFSSWDQVREVVGTAP